MDDSTRLPQTPPLIASRLRALLGEDYAPDPGTVHRLGKAGESLAWIKRGWICEASHHEAGCLPELSKPVEWGRGDPDLVGAGEPAYVSGLANDDVLSVTATLSDGRSVSSEVTSNYYNIMLPSDARPWDVAGITALMRDGSTYEDTIAISQ